MARGPKAAGLSGGGSFDSRQPNHSIRGLQVGASGQNTNLFVWRRPAWRDNVLKRIKTFPRRFDRSDTGAWNINRGLGQRHGGDIARGNLEDYPPLYPDPQFRPQPLPKPNNPTNHPCPPPQSPPVLAALPAHEP